MIRYPYPLDRVEAAGHGVYAELHAPNLVVVRGPRQSDTPLDSWMWLCYRTQTGTLAEGWAALLFRCASRPAGEGPELAPGQYLASWELVADGDVAAFRNVRPVMVRRNGATERTLGIHLFEVADESELDGSIGLEVGAMPRLVACLRRLWALRGGQRALSLALVEG